MKKARSARVIRKTAETAIAARLRLDGSGQSSIATGIPFFDHMLTLFARHSLVDLALKCRGDLEVDAHHTVEDCGLVLGQAFREALADKRGIQRYGAGFDPPTPKPARGEAYIPMDECLVRCVIDFGGRPHLVWRGLQPFAYERLAARNPESDPACAFRFGLAREFFQAYANEAKCNLHLELLYGDEPHHIVEALFKAFARAVEAACGQNPRRQGQLPTTKGRL